MGVTYVEGTVKGARGPAVVLQFLVDSWAQYTLIPQAAWKRMGLKPKRTAVFRLADGSPIERDISECHITLPQGDGHTPVVLGQPGDEPLLGVVTLEEFGLVLNPFNRSLQPMRLMM